MLSDLARMKVYSHVLGVEADLPRNSRQQHPASQHQCLQRAQMRFNNSNASLQQMVTRSRYSLSFARFGRVRREPRGSELEALAGLEPLARQTAAGSYVHLRGNSQSYGLWHKGAV